MKESEKLRKLIDTYKLCDYEKTSLDYCKLVLLAQNGGGETAILIYSGDELEKNAVSRDLKFLNIRLEKFISEKDAMNNSVEFVELLKSDTVIISTIDVTSLLNRINSMRENLFTKYLNQLKRKFGDNIRSSTSKILRIDVPYWRLRREEIFDFARTNIDELSDFYDKLGDDESRKVLYEIIRCSAENDCYTIKQGNQFDKYWECYSHKDDEVWVNCGSAAGDTIVKFLYHGFAFKKIYAYEGSESVYKDLTECLNLLPDEIRRKIESNNSYLGINDVGNNFDNTFKNIPVTLINMDIEGAEMGVLQGAKELIKEKRPVLSVCAYHKATDLLDIPRLINGVADDYVFFVRKYIGYEINALNEYVYYAVPLERIANPHFS